MLMALSQTFPTKFSSRQDYSKSEVVEIERSDDHELLVVYQISSGQT